MSQERVEELARRVEALERENGVLKQLSTRLSSLQGHLLEILNNTPAPIYLKDSEGRYLLVNRRYEKLAHASLADVVGKTDFDIFPEQVALLFRAQDQEVMQTRSFLEFEETIALPAGQFTFITLKFPLFDANGKVQAVGGFCTDISERKKIEEEKASLILGLQRALDEVKTLRGIIPICAFCKRIRDDQGYWTQVEAYLSARTEVGFSHGYCPECLTTNFPYYAK